MKEDLFNNEDRSHMSTSMDKESPNGSISLLFLFYHTIYLSTFNSWGYLITELLLPMSINRLARLTCWLAIFHYSYTDKIRESGRRFKFSLQVFSPLSYNKVFLAFVLAISLKDYHRKSHLWFYGANTLLL